MIKSPYMEAGIGGDECTRILHWLHLITTPRGALLGRYCGIVTWFCTQRRLESQAIHATLVIQFHCWYSSHAVTCYLDMRWPWLTPWMTVTVSFAFRPSFSFAFWSSLSSLGCRQILIVYYLYPSSTHMQLQKLFHPHCRETFDLSFYPAR